MSKIISCFSAVFDVKRFSKIIREEHFVTLSYNIHVPNQCMNPMWCDYFISYFVNDECFFCNQILSSFESVFYQKKRLGDLLLRLLSAMGVFLSNTLFEPSAPFLFFCID